MWRILILSALFIISPPCVQAQDNLALMLALFSPDEAEQVAAARTLAASGDSGFIAPFVDALYFKRDLPAGVLDAMRKLSGQNIDADWPAWMEWLGSRPILPAEDYREFKRILFSQIDAQFSKMLNPQLPSRIRWDEIAWGGVRKDGIPALDNPKMVSVAEATYLNDDDDVFGLYINGEAAAFPLRIINWHEMVNTKIGGMPVSLSWCTLCGAAIPFDTRRKDGPAFTFGSSGMLYRSNKLMYDRQTNSLWSAMRGVPVVGAMAKDSLQLPQYPLVRSSWAAWKEKHPNTVVLSDKTGFIRQYKPQGAYKDYFQSPATMFPVAQRDHRLAAKSWVFGLHNGDATKAYPLVLFKNRRLLHDRFGDRYFLLLRGKGALEMRAYKTDGRHFQTTSSRNFLKDDRNSLWKIEERGLVETASKKLLPRWPGYIAYWFAWYAFFPESELRLKR